MPNPDRGNPVMDKNQENESTTDRPQEVPVKSRPGGILSDKGRVLLATGWSLLHHTPRRLKRLAILLAVRPFRALQPRSVPGDTIPTVGSAEGTDDSGSTPDEGNRIGIFGIIGGFFAWIGRILLTCLEIVGIGELLQLLWNLVFRTRKLTSEESTAFRVVFPDLAFRMKQVRVHPGSPICRINGGRAVTSFYLIHLPGKAGSMDLMVHELAHALQYETVGGVYMFEALYAQFFGGGYDYGDLKTQREQGERLHAFNREQQAQICQDYYRVLQGKFPLYSGSRETLTPYIDDWRSLAV